MKATIALLATLASITAASAECPTKLPVLAEVTDVVAVGWDWHQGAFMWKAFIQFEGGKVHEQIFRGRPYLFKGGQAQVTACNEDGIQNLNR